MALADDIDGLAQAAVARFRADLGAVLERLTRHFKATLADAEKEGGKLSETALNRELAAKLGAGYAAALRAAGYDAALGKLLAAFERITKANARFVGDELGASYSTPNLKALARLAEGSVDELLLRGGSAGDRLREIVLAGAHTNAPIADVVEKLAEAADITLRQAIVEAQTQLMAFSRDALATQAQESGIDLYTYEGPEDSITRPFCDPLVGKIVTLQDLDGMDNGESSPKPVSRFLGGFRCRHSLAPISLEEARAMYASKGKRAVGPGCHLALRIVTGKEDGPAFSAWVERNGGAARASAPQKRQRRAPRRSSALQRGQRTGTERR